MSRIYYILLFLSCVSHLTNSWLINKIDDTVPDLKSQSSSIYDCANGDFIQSLFVCDGFSDCEDGSDETEQVCKDFLRCSSSQFRCDDGTCINLNKVCDGVGDCYNSTDEDVSKCKYSDENFQSVQKRDVPEGYTCKNGKIIPALFKCDGKADCQDGSDETQELCSDSKCFWNLFRCNYGACIPQDKMCDGQNDCVDKSDEDLGMCSSNGNQNISLLTGRNKRQASCEFRCGSGECISLDQVCDGIPHCKDSSDETRNECRNVRCPSFLFQCKYGACIPKNQVCNGERNCADGSDEEGPECGNRASEDTCKNFEFRCNDGTCIDNLDVCDGRSNCPDGSDETEESCIGLVCPTYLYRCAYGACVHKRARCNGVQECADGSDEAGCGPATPAPPPPVTPTVPVVIPSNGCLLPSHPSNGKFELASSGGYQTNGAVDESTVIKLTCNQEYRTTDYDLFFCNAKKWEPDLKKAVCKQTCRSLGSNENSDVECRLEGRIVSCENPISGTTAHISCKAYYVYYATRQIPVCANGVWDPYPAPCDPECGKKIVNVETLIIGGSDAQKGEYPWMMAIYNTSLGQKLHICGGSIISRTYVLSAAHCFCTPDGKKNDESFFTLVAGKYYRDLDIKETGVQTRKIQRLFVHEDYRGLHRKYEYDIALVKIESLEMSLQVQPVCIDWSSSYEERDFIENTTAVVAGWGYTTEGENASEVLKKLIVPFRTTETCKKYMDPHFYDQYYSSSKICAGYKDKGESVCSGDSGGGLFFKSRPATFYVRAVVSLAPRHLTGCNSNHYALYTKVSKFLDWLEGITLKRL